MMAPSPSMVEFDGLLVIHDANRYGLGDAGQGKRWELLTPFSR